MRCWPQVAGPQVAGLSLVCLYTVVMMQNIYIATMTSGLLLGVLGRV